MNSLTRTLPTPALADDNVRFATKPQPAPRILVLVPSLELDLTESARKVWGLARASNASIHFVGRCDDPSQEPAVRRGLTTLSTMVQGEHIATSIGIASKKEWFNLTLNPGNGDDLVVYFPKNQTTPSRKTPGIPAQLTVWIVSLAILVGFFFIQADIARFFHDWLQTALLILSTLAEFGLIWLVDRLL